MDPIASLSRVRDAINEAVDRLDRFSDEEQFRQAAAEERERLRLIVAQIEADIRELADADRT